jgi:RHS repeat-associated protein
VHYVFDRAGDLVYKGDPNDRAANDNLELLWDANHRLAESRKNGEVTTYGYDPLGRRVFKRNPTHTTWFYWDGDALLGEVQQANDEPDAAPIWNENVADFGAALKRKNKLKRLHEKVREYVYYPGTFVPLALVNKGVPSLEISAANEERAEATDDTIPAFNRVRHASRARLSPPVVPFVYYYHTDPNGCPTRLTDASGQVRWSAGYEAWGGVAAQHVDQIGNPLRLQGQYYDEETELYYNRYRYYDPDTGSFIGQDPIGLAGGLNPYQFAPNTFVWIDPLGLNCTPKDAQRKVIRRQAPREIIRIDAPESSITGSQWHAHGKNGGAINLDGTIHDGDPQFSRKTLDWLREHGWNV